LRLFASCARAEACWARKTGQSQSPNRPKQRNYTGETGLWILALADFLWLCAVAHRTKLQKIPPNVDHRGAISRSMF
jgi:hypothetical protein